MASKIHTGKRRSFLRRYLILWLPAVLLLMGAVLYRPLLAVERFAADYILYCPLHALTGLYCPGCGGTRSLTALLHGDFLLAVHENPIVPGLLLFFVLLWAERAGRAFGKQWRLYPRSRKFWYTLCGLLIVWDIARNCIPALMPTSI